VDIANLRAEEVDWESKTLCFFTRKTSVPVIVHLRNQALNIFRDLPRRPAVPLFVTRPFGGPCNQVQASRKMGSRRSLRFMT
jgi:hypothetical protein